MAVGENGSIITASDGESPPEWTLQESGTTERLNGVAFGRFVF